MRRDLILLFKGWGANTTKHQIIEGKNEERGSTRPKKPGTNG
jgi:hypothetical protein